MIELVHRRDLGFEDEFEGYVFLKENHRQRPVLQFHLYKYDSGKNYLHTLFWRGRTTFEEITQCLTETIKEVAKTKKRTLSELSSGSLYVAQNNTFESVRFEVKFPGDDDEVGEGAVQVKHGLIDAQVGQTIAFARFDVKSDDELSIILWADLHGGDAAEVGFSFSNLDVPTPILFLFQSTCFEEITSDELEAINRNIWDHSRVPVGV